MKQALILVLMLTVITISAFGADTRTASAVANVTASVNATFTCTNQTDLVFGTVNQGSAKVVSAINNGTGATAARFLLVGSASTLTTVTATFPANLGNVLFPFTAGNLSSNTTNNQGGSSVLVSGVGTNTSNIGELYVWLGGTATADVILPEGAYSTTATLTATQP